MTRTKNAPSDLNSPRAFRGGSWFDLDTAAVRAAYRSTVAPSSRVNYLSFRTSLPGRMKR